MSDEETPKTLGERIVSLVNGDYSFSFNQMGMGQVMFKLGLEKRGLEEQVALPTDHLNERKIIKYIDAMQEELWIKSKDQDLHEGVQIAKRHEALELDKLQDRDACDFGINIGGLKSFCIRINNNVRARIESQAWDSIKLGNTFVAYISNVFYVTSDNGNWNKLPVEEFIRKYKNTYEQE